MANLKKGEYKQPRAINPVSVFLFLLLGSGVYLAYIYLPVYLAHYRVKQVVHESASKFYKIRTLEPSLRAQEANNIVENARREIVQILGYDDPQMTVQMLINDETKVVNVVAQYRRAIVFPGMKKDRVQEFKAVGESDFKPNEW